ncbi:MAG: CDP-alcohol phosphatidyltransferase family protein [Bacteroidaceae bacterium]|nr:CDP-alcohol phosphatidyltransferase family protein [Bacteroidaceae bacterium]
MTFQTFRNGIQQGVYKLIDAPVRLLVRLGVTPNWITTLGLLGNVLAAVLIVRAALSVWMASSFGMPVSYALLGWAGLCIIVFSICDMVDGYMARTHHLESRFGAFYDSVLDRYQELVVLSAIAFYFMVLGDWGSSLITALALIGSIMVSYVRARAEGLGCECKVGLMQRPERVVVLVLGLLLAGFLQHVVPFNSLWFLLGAVVLIAVLANWTAIVRILHVKKQLDVRDAAEKGN